LGSLSGKKPEIPLQWKVFVTCIVIKLYFRGEMKRKNIALLGVLYKEKSKVDHLVWRSCLSVCLRPSIGTYVEQVIFLQSHMRDSIIVARKLRLLVLIDS
jgi:hypothetical protein